MRYPNKPILLVEDDAVDVLTVRRALRDLDLTDPRLEVVGNGEEALDFLHDPDRPQPCLILLDLNMPRMNGLEFLRRVRDDGCAAGIPVVVLTTSRQDQDIVEGFELSVAGFMVKPVDYHRFLEMMQAISRYWTLSELPC